MKQSCDNCNSQEGRHYCLLHSRQIKNMDQYKCDDWREIMGRPSKVKELEQEIEKLKKLILKCEPVKYVHNGDIQGAFQWENDCKEMGIKLEDQG